MSLTATFDSDEFSPPRRIYLVCSAGFPNYGDELIVAQWLRQIAERAPEADVWVDTPSPGLATVLLDGLHPKVRFVDTLWRLCWAAPSDEPWEVASWMDRAVADPGQAPRWAAGVELLHNMDLVHVVGGGYLVAHWPRHVGVLAAALVAKRIGAARLAMTGQGLVPVPEHCAELYGTLAAGFDVVDVRDEASEELLRTNGVPHAQFSCDDAFLSLGPSASILSTTHQPPEFMLCAQADMLAIDRSRLAGLILRTLRSWRVRPENLGIVEGIPGVDREIYALLEHQLPGARFYPFTEVWRDGLPAAPGQTWLSTRFHPHLVAASAGASGVAIPVSPDYYLTKHRSLINQGSRWTLAEDLAVPALPTEGGFPAEVVGRQHNRKLTIAAGLYGRGNEPVAAPETITAPAGRQRRWDRTRRITR